MASRHSAWFKEVPLVKEKISIPGAAKAMYLTYLGALLVVLYTGFNIVKPFLEGWRYPWATSFAANLNLTFIWVLGLVSLVYLYYASLGRPRGWKEPLGWARIILALLGIWFFFLSYAVLFPRGWMSWLVSWIGGYNDTLGLYRLFLPIMIIVNSLYILAYYFIRQYGGEKKGDVAIQTGKEVA
jgi:hypothetical protein